LISSDSGIFSCLPGPVLTTGMCTELFQFDTSPVTSAPSEESSNAAAKDVAESVASEAAQGNTHNNASSKNSLVSVFWITLN
jgi:hypothetical protein